MSKAKDLVKSLNKLLGDGTIRLGSDPQLEVKYLPTGVLPVDVLLEGGFPRGRSMEIFGNYSTLKSYVALSAMGRTQDNGGTVALVDTEHAFDPQWAETFGVDVDSLVYQAPETGEIAVDVTEVLLREGVDLIVWDSVAALLPQSEQTKRLHGEKQQPARLAALMSAAMRKLTAANKHQTSLVFINQTREKVGVMYGSNETTPGGRALPFYASYRLALRKAGTQKREVKQWDGDQMKTVKETYGQKIRATLEKSKLNAPHRDAYFTYDLETGEVDQLGYTVARLLELGMIKKRGRKWFYEDEEYDKAGMLKQIALVTEDVTYEAGLEWLI